MRRILFFILVIAFAVSAIDYASITVKNNTDVYIHAQIGDKWVLDIPPGGGESGAVAVEKGDSVFCRAIVAPGQPMAGTVIDTATLVISEGDPVPFNCEDVTGGYYWNTDTLTIKGK